MTNTKGSRVGPSGPKFELFAASQKNPAKRAITTGKKSSRILVTSIKNRLTLDYMQCYPLYNVENLISKSQIWQWSTACSLMRQ